MSDDEWNKFVEEFKTSCRKYSESMQKVTEALREITNRWRRSRGLPEILPEDELN